MLSIESYLAQIQESESFDELVCFPDRRVCEVLLAEPNRSFLLEAGLPEWAAPHLHFGDFSNGEYLPSVIEWSWRREEPPLRCKDLFVIGDDPEDDPICVEAGSNRIIILRQDDGFSVEYMNASVPALAEIVLCYSCMVEEALNRVGESAFVANKIPSELVEIFRTAVARIDMEALTVEAFWAQEISRLLR